VVTDSQARQSADPQNGLKWPIWHGTHRRIPETEDNFVRVRVPGSHSVQVVLAGTLLIVPGKQTEHICCPIASLKNPISHGSHVVCPGKFCTYPAPHGMECEERLVGM
jgi:hypothetical protein